jgi:hypothetical protein
MKKSGYVNGDHGKLWYEIGGDGEMLVLVHAGFVDSRIGMTNGRRSRKATA